MERWEPAIEYSHIDYLLRVPSGEIKQVLPRQLAGIALVYMWKGLSGQKIHVLCLSCLNTSGQR